LSDSQRGALTALVERMARGESWQRTLEKFGWVDSYLAGDAFDAFLDSERTRVARIVSRLRGPAVAAGEARVGEWVFPAFVLTAGSIVMLALLVSRAPTPDAPRHPRGAAGPVRVSIGLALFVALLEVAGFVAAGAVLFACTASAFGSRASLRDTVAGAALCGIVYLLFAHGLGIPLPAGMWTR
jgi:putative tricarboxylic transport membrane protein